MDDRISPTGYKVNQAATNGLMTLNRARSEAMRFLSKAPDDPLKYASEMIKLVNAIDATIVDLTNIEQWSRRR